MEAGLNNKKIQASAQIPLFTNSGRMAYSCVFPKPFLLKYNKIPLSTDT
jgi:hypothetical protein